MTDVTTKATAMLEEMYPDMPLLISRSNDDFYATQIAHVCQPDGILLSEISVYTKWYAYPDGDQNNPPEGENNQQQESHVKVKCEGSICYQHRDLGPKTLNFDFSAIIDTNPEVTNFESLSDQLTTENGLTKSQGVEILLSVQHQFNVALDTLVGAIQE